MNEYQFSLIQGNVVTIKQTQENIKLVQKLGELNSLKICDPSDFVRPVYINGETMKQMLEILMAEQRQRIINYEDEMREALNESNG